VYALWLRAQCLLKQLEVESALTDLERAQRLARLEDDPEALEALHALHQSADALQRQLDLYGGAASFRLHQQAIEAFNSDRPEQAAALLRQALRVAHPDGCRKLEEGKRSQGVKFTSH